MGHNINGVEINERALAEFKKKCLQALSENKPNQK